MNNDLLIEALVIARDNFDFDGEHDKSETVQKYIQELMEG